MKFSKKSLVLLLTFVMTFSIGLSGCKTPTPTPPPAPTVASIVFTNTADTIAAGKTVIGAKCLPEGVSQEFTAKLDEPVYGVSFADKTLSVHAGAKKGDKVSITVTSVADTTKKATKTFTLDIATPTYVEIKTANDLVEMMSTAESMAKNYKLTDDITLKTTVEEVPVDIKWKASEFPFTGLLDGAGFSIKGLDMASADANTGFFKENQGVIRNIGFDNSQAPAKWMRLGANSAVVAGKNSGAISNVFTNIPLASASGTAAALVGINTGFIENSYAIGATVSNDTTGIRAGVIGENLGSVSGVVADKATTHLETFYGAKGAQTDVSANAKLLNSVQMQTAKTYSDMKWDSKIWYYTGVYPMLKNDAFLEEDIIKSIKISSPTIIEIGDLSGGDVKIYQLSLERKNSMADEIDWSITSVTGSSVTGDVTVTPDGVLTLKAPTATAVGGDLDGVKVSVKAVIKNSDPEISSTANFEIRNDGYSTAKGIEVSDYDELYNVFFRVGEETVEAHNRNITRVIKLKNSIALPQIAGATDPRVKAKYNWPGVLDFSGVFDGQGYAITGLDVTTGNGETVYVPNGDKSVEFDGNAAFGFFRRVGHLEGWPGDERDKNAGGEPGTIRNLALTNGKINYVGPNEYDRRAIGGLVQMFGSGLIENVLVDLTIHSFSNWSGMIVGQMGGVRSVDAATVKGTAILRNSIAMGKITSETTAKPRPDVDPYPCGAIVGYTTTDGSEMINCFARGAANENKNITNRLMDESDGGLIVNSARIQNVGFKTADEFVLKSTFDGMGFPEIWSFKDGAYPMLKAGAGWTDSDQIAAPTEIEITNKLEDTYYYSELVDGTKSIQTVTEVMNSKGNAVSYKIEPAVTGVSVSNTGVVTVDATFAETPDEGVNVTIVATVGTNLATASTSFKIANSGYVPSVGMSIGTVQELYDMLIVGGLSGELDNSAAVTRNLTRNLKLTANITLPATANNWKGIGDNSNKFTGKFDGQGHTIRGLNMTTVNGTYGFFKFVDSKEPNAVVIENLGLEGVMNFEGGPDGNGDSRVGALVGEHRGGIIQNVVVDVDMTAPNAKLMGKIVGYMEGAADNDKAKIYNSIAMGLMEGKQEAFAPGWWQTFTAGALVGKVEGNKNDIDSCFALKESLSALTGIACRSPQDSGGSKPSNSGYFWKDKFTLADTYNTAAKPFNSGIWSIKAGCMPMLKNSIDTTHAQEVLPADIMLANADETYIYKDMAKTITLESLTVNAPADFTVEYAFTNTPSHVTLVDNIITIGTVPANVEVTIKVVAKIKLGTEVKATSAEVTFIIKNETAVQITTEDELFAALIGDGSDASKAIVDANMSREIKLMNDITLVKHANWPGVQKTFTGHFDGQGYAIKGLNVTKNGGGYGFFMDVLAPTRDQVVIERLTIDGTINYTCGNSGDEMNRRVGALAKIFKGGTIQNVLVTATISTDTIQCGAIVGFMSSNATLKSSIAMARLSTSLEYKVPNGGDRPSYCAYALGALVGKTEGGANLVASYAVINPADLATATHVIEGTSYCDISLTNRGTSINGDGNKDDFTSIKTAEELKVATALGGMDATAWVFSATALPTLAK